MYTLYTDKVENFKCSIDLEGASLDDTKVRLVLENNKLNLLYEGEVDSNGNCTIPISKLKNVLKEGTNGTMKLEVIAEDTYFSPWEDDFKVATNKKVTVEVLSNSKDTIKESKVKVKVDYKKPANKIVKESTKKVQKTVDHPTILTKILERKGITKQNITENIDPVSRVIFKYTKLYKVKDHNELLVKVLDKINN
tara:strand:- start:7324 stop:7908 length:585 start_codon:yes stop_codon:yes gene_type:complete